MNWKRLAGLSFLLNAVVLAGLFAVVSKRTAVREMRMGELEISAGTSLRALPQLGPAVRTLNWGQIESTNYLDYIANLRSIGCPERTIHDIVSADVATTLREIRYASPSTAPTTTWQQDPERLVNELMGGSPVQETARSHRGVAVDSSMVNETVRSRDRQALLGRYATRPGANRMAPDAQSSDAGTGPTDNSVVRDELVADQSLVSPEIVRQRWIATYIRTRYGQQAWNDFEQESSEFGGDIEALMQNRNIPIPEEPRRLLPVAR